MYLFFINFGRLLFQFFSTFFIIINQRNGNKQKIKTAFWGLYVKLTGDFGDTIYNICSGKGPEYCDRVKEKMQSFQTQELGHAGLEWDPDAFVLQINWWNKAMKAMVGWVMHQHTTQLQEQPPWQSVSLQEVISLTRSQSNKFMGCNDSDIMENFLHSRNIWKYFTC